MVTVTDRHDGETYGTDATELSAFLRRNEPGGSTAVPQAADPAPAQVCS
jgi:hypothetical protein